MDNELRSKSQRIDKANNIELENIVDGVQNSIEKGIQTEDLFGLPVRELLGLDKTLQTIRGSLILETAKKSKIEYHIEKENKKLEEMENDTTYMDEQRDEVRKRLEELSDDLASRNETIDDIKGKLKSQITSIRETISKVLDSDTTLGEKIRTLFREQGITIASILTAFGMAIGVLVETLLPSGGVGSTTTPSNNTGGDGNDKTNAKEWIKNKLQALASLLGKLAAKAGAALPGILGSIISWILTRAKEVVGWLSQNLWALIVGIGGLIYTYLVTRK